jgi:hypothetical protein
VKNVNFGQVKFDQVIVCRLFEDNFQLSSEAKNIFCVKTNYLYQTTLNEIKGRENKK